MNTHIALNFMRSANAPAISAGVMIANVIWYIMYTVSGIVKVVELSVPAPRVNGTVAALGDVLGDAVQEQAGRSRRYRAPCRRCRW